MYALRWDKKVEGKYQYAMHNNLVSVTSHLSKAEYFVEPLEAQAFKEENKLDCFTVVEVAEDKILEDVKEVLEDMKEQALFDFRRAVVNAKRCGLGVEELHNLVDNIGYEA